MEQLKQQEQLQTIDGQDVARRGELLPPQDGGDIQKHDRGAPIGGSASKERRRSGYPVFGFERRNGSAVFRIWPAGIHLYVATLCALVIAAYAHNTAWTGSFSWVRVLLVVVGMLGIFYVVARFLYWRRRRRS